MTLYTNLLIIVTDATHTWCPCGYFHHGIQWNTVTSFSFSLAFPLFAYVVSQTVFFKGKEKTLASSYVCIRGSRLDEIAVDRYRVRVGKQFPVNTVVPRALRTRRKNGMFSQPPRSHRRAPPWLSHCPAQSRHEAAATRDCHPNLHRTLS